MPERITVTTVVGMAGGIALVLLGGWTVMKAQRVLGWALVAALLAALVWPLRGILGFEERPLVSIDFLGDPRSGVVDALSTMVVNGTHVKIYAWYDNEWGYVNRTAELVRLVGAADR